MPTKSLKTLCPVEFASQKPTKNWIKDVVNHTKTDLEKKIDFSRPFSNTAGFIKFQAISKLPTWEDDELLELPMVMLQALDRCPQSYMSCHMPRFVNMIATLAHKSSYKPTIVRNKLIAHIFPMIHEKTNRLKPATRRMTPPDFTVSSTTDAANTTDYQRQFHLVTSWNAFVNSFSSDLENNGHKIDTPDQKINYGVSGCFFNKAWEKKGNLTQNELLTAIAEQFGIMLFAISTNCANLDEAKKMLGKFHQFRISRSWPNYDPINLYINKLGTLVGNNYKTDDIALAHYLSDSRAKVVNAVAKPLASDTQKNATTRKLVTKNIEHLFYFACVGRIHAYSPDEVKYIKTIVNGIWSSLPAGSSALKNWTKFVGFLTKAIDENVACLDPSPLESSNLFCATLKRTNMNYNKSKVKISQKPANKFETAFQMEIDSNDGTLSDLSTTSLDKNVAPAIDIRPLSKISSRDNYIDVDDIGQIKISKVASSDGNRTILRPVVSRIKNDKSSINASSSSKYKNKRRTHKEKERRNKPVN